MKRELHFYPGSPVRSWAASWEPFRTAASTWANTRSWREASWAETTPLFSGASDWKLRMNSIVSWKKETLLQKQFSRKIYNHFINQFYKLLNKSFLWFSFSIKNYKEPKTVTDDITSSPTPSPISPSPAAVVFWSFSKASSCPERQRDCKHGAMLFRQTSASSPQEGHLT